jgi:YVTN family beta-propeller protein/VCBS repeat-containing protein
MVSSEGSTPSSGEGSVERGAGPDAKSGPNPAGSNERSNEPIPGVIVRSSGGALTPGEHGTSEEDAQKTDDPQPESKDAASQQSTEAATEPATATPDERVTSSALTMPTPSSMGEAERSKLTAPGPGPAAVPWPNRLVVPRISAIPGVPEMFRVGGWAADASGAGPLATDAPHGTETLSARRDSVADTESRPPLVSLRIVTSVLAAALALFAVPVPGGQAQEPTLWTIFAWVRRQPGRNVVDEQRGQVAAPRQTELVGTTPDVATAAVDRIDQVTGRVTGHVNVADEPDGLTYALAAQIDPRLGTATVDGASGHWTFTPNQLCRLAARLSQSDEVAEFSVVASDGMKVDVSAPVAPAEAAVTDTIDVGEGLTYGMAVVEDRLYVLNSPYDSGGNGFVKMIDTSTKAVAGSIEVGSTPFALAVSGHTLYVGNAGDGTVSVVDVATNTVVDQIDVGATPFGLEVTGDRLYVADHAGTVSVIDLNDNTELARIPIGGDPFGVAATADRVYVTNYVGGTVAVFDQATNTALDTIEAPGANLVGVTGYPYFAAVVGGRLYVVNSATNALTVIDRSVSTVVDVDPVTRAVDAIPGGAAPVDIIVRGDRLYVSNVNCGSVTVIDVATNQPVETIGVGIQPGLMTATLDGRTIYVADVMDGTVRVITSVHPEVYGSAG